MRKAIRQLPAALALLSLAACTAGRGYPPHHGAPAIPEGHLPPPGECRIWYADRPPGQQPPPGPCEQLRYQVPPGAYLVRG